MIQNARLYSNADGTWDTLSQTFTVCNREYRFSFDKNGDNGQGTASLTRSTGISGADDGEVFPLVRGGSGCNWLEFAVGDRMVCTGTVGCGGGCANIAKFRVEQIPCEWDGDAWYCAGLCERRASLAPVFITSDDLVGADYQIYAGPFATQAEAITACYSTGCCGGETLSVVIYAKIASTCACFDGLVIPLYRLGEFGCYYSGEVGVTCDGHATRVRIDTIGPFDGSVTAQLWLNGYPQDFTGFATETATCDPLCVKLGTSAAIVSGYAGCESFTFSVTLSDNPFGTC